MLERWTIDVVAERVAPELMTGQVTPKLVHKFFRKGRRDGRRGYAHESVFTLLEDALDLAGQQLCAEYVARRQQLEISTAEKQARIALGEQAVDPADGSVGEEVSTPATLPPDNHAEALKRLHKTRAEASRRAAAAERAALRSAGRESTIGAAIDDAEFPGLLEEFRRRYDVARRATGMLWDRYVNGYAQGGAGRGARTRDRTPPDPVFEAHYPPLLASLDGNRSALIPTAESIR